MNLISMLFQASLVVVSHWIMSGDSSGVVLGVRGETVVAGVDELDCRLIRSGIATTDETLVSATRAQGARVAVKNFIVMDELTGCWAV